MKLELTLGAALMLGAPLQAGAQSEDRLRQFFEGTTVVVKLDMPGTEQGIDVYPGTSMAVDFPRHATRLKRYGTAIRRGDSILVTKIRVKKDLIEFQLGGGGYGTFGDDDSPYVFTPSVSKTEREKNLERDVKNTTDPGAKRKLREELDALRKEREREEARLRAEAAQAQQIKEANIRQRRLEGGSRFNLRYRAGVPPEALTPGSVMAALADLVSFGPMAGAPPTGAAAEPSPGSLRKGMTMDQVEAFFGRPESLTPRMEGKLRVVTAVYLRNELRVEAEFVEEVLIRFTVSSR